MTNRELAVTLGHKIRTERAVTNEILSLINLALERRAYLELGYSSMFDWLVKGFGYSNASAYRRIEAAKMLKAVPEIKEKLECGQVNLTTISKAHIVVKAQEKLSGKKIGADQKAQLVRKIESKSVRDAERSLFEIFPEAAASINQDRREVLNESQTRYHVTLSSETDAKLNRAKEVLSHKFPNGAAAVIIDYALGFLLEKLDPLQKVTKPGSKSRSRVTIINHTDGGCSFRDPVTGKICGSKHQVQIDHIIPKALGGSDEPENLRALCRQHNMHAAEKAFGHGFMEKFRRPN